MRKRILVVAAHADDEVLGCGGTMARHTTEGDEVHVVIMADGVGAREANLDEALDVRNRAMVLALTTLGAKSWNVLGFPDNQMDTLSMLSLVKSLEPFIARFAPHTIYTHHAGDLNVDHRMTHQAVLTACRPQPGCAVREILAFEVVSSTEWSSYGQSSFTPNVFMDIGDYWEPKRKALDAYGFEMRSFPHSRSVEHVEILSRHRGACVGLLRAEAFKLIRSLR